MDCPPSNQPFDIEWCHQLLREAYGSHGPRVHYSELHQVAERMAKVLAARLVVMADEELIAALNKVQVLVGFIDKQGLLDEHHFIFPDGDTWEATGVAVVKEPQDGKQETAN